jgi:protocatechuate 3,4-dioxygenase beta subunit
MRTDRLSSRRLLLKRAVAFGTLGVGASAYFARAQGLAPTPECHDGDQPTKPDIEGPFFKPSSPERFDLVAPGTPGWIIGLDGFVLSRSCRPVTGAVLDLWQADENGDYDDQGFRYRGHLFSDSKGRYRFRTIVPGLYPGRTRHFHMKVQAPGQDLLTTQLYFPDEPRNFIDDYFSPRLLLQIAQNSGTNTARFDFILDLA